MLLLLPLLSIGTRVHYAAQWAFRIPVSFISAGLHTVVVNHSGPRTRKTKYVIIVVAHVSNDTALTPTCVVYLAHAAAADIAA